jgi:hypothetical protein
MIQSLRQAVLPEPLEQRLLLSMPHTIDLAVFFTPAAVEALGPGAGDAQMLAQIQADVEDANLALANSRVDIEIRLVSAQRLDYAEGPNMATDLDRLRRVDDGFLDEVHLVRWAVGADLVTLYRARGSSLISGLSYQLTDASAAMPDPLTGRAPAAAFAFSVVAVGGRWVLAHELAHKLGAGHDLIQTPGGGMTADAAGYRHDDGQVSFRTIMAMGPEPLIPYFSNPDVLYDGVPTGVANVADNARAMNQVAPAVAGYYTMPAVEQPPPEEPPAPPPPPALPAAPPPDVAPPRGRLSAATIRRGMARPHRFTITFTDQSPISKRPLRDAVLVTGPAGYRQPAKLVSIRASADGRTVSAVYEVVGRGKKWDSSANGTYQVRIRGRTVFDAARNFMPVQTVGIFKVAIPRQAS